jgi:hypothetical protein
VNANAVHLDISFGGRNLENFSAVRISTMKKSPKARGQILKILPKLRRIASHIVRTYGIEVFAFGKESVPVRIAELTSGAPAIRYAAEKALKENTKLRLGLPVKCQPKFMEDGIELLSLMAAENDVVGYSECSRKLLKEVQMLEMLNPCARGFKLLEITPSKEVKSSLYPAFMRHQRLFWRRSPNRPISLLPSGLVLSSPEICCSPEFF